MLFYIHNPLFSSFLLLLLLLVLCISRSHEFTLNKWEIIHSLHNVYIINKISQSWNGTYANSIITASGCIVRGKHYTNIILH